MARTARHAARSRPSSPGALALSCEMLKFYIASMFLLHGLSPVQGVTLGYMVACVAMLSHTLHRPAWLSQARLRLDDDHFVTLFLLGLLPLLWSSHWSGQQAFTYSLLWALSWALAFWWLREWMLLERIRFDQISAAAAAGCVVLAASVVAEFALANLQDRYLSDLLPFSIREFPQANVLDEAFKRPRGYASEAGFTAIAFECLLPLAAPWAWQTPSRRLLFGLLVIPGFLLLFSAAALTTLLITAAAYLGLRHGWGLAATLGICLAAFLTGLALTVDEANWLLYEVVLRKFLEFAPGDIAGHEHSFSRPEAYALGVTMIFERPWGMGWGAVSQAAADGRPLFGTELRGSGLISVPLEIGASAGVLGMLLYLAAVIHKLRRLTQLPGTAARATFFCLTWVALHHSAVLEIWFPMLWFALALADVVWLNSAPSSRRHHAWRHPQRRAATMALAPRLSGRQVET